MVDGSVALHSTRWGSPQNHGRECTDECKALYMLKGMVKMLVTVTTVSATLNSWHDASDRIRNMNVMHVTLRKYCASNSLEPGYPVWATEDWQFQSAGEKLEATDTGVRHKYDHKRVIFFLLLWGQQPFRELQHGEAFSPGIIYNFKKMDRKDNVVFLKKPICSTI